MLVKLNLTKDLLYVLELYISFTLRLVVTLIIDSFGASIGQILTAFIKIKLRYQ